MQRFKFLTLFLWVALAGLGIADAAPIQPSAETQTQTTAKNKLASLLKLLQGSGSQPTNLYTAQLSNSTEGVNFTIPGTDLGGTTFYTRKSGSPDIWHVGLAIDASEANKIQPLTSAYQELSAMIGSPTFESLVLIVSEDAADVNPSMFSNSNKIKGAITPFANGAGSNKKVKLSKGVNVFARIKTPDNGPLKTLERVMLAGGKITSGTLNLSGSLGYDVLDKILAADDVVADTDKLDEAKSEEKNKTTNPSPFSIAISLPQVTPVPFSSMIKSDAIKVLYSEIQSTTLSVSIDRGTKTASVSATQKNKIWIGGRDFIVDSAISIEEKPVSGGKQITLTSTGGVDISTSKQLNLGSDDFKLVGLSLAGTSSFTVKSNGDVEQNTEGGISAGVEQGSTPKNSLGFKLGATVKAKSTTYKGSIKLTVEEESSNKLKIKDVSIALDEAIDFGTINATRKIDLLKKITISDLSFGISPAKKGGAADFYITAGAQIGEVGGKLAFVTRNRQMFVIVTANQFSVADVVDAFGNANSLTGQERETMASVVMPQVIIALGAPVGGKASATDPLRLEDLPLPVQKMVAGVITDSKSTIPISTDGLAVVGKVDFDKLAPSVKNSMGEVGVTATGDLLAAVSISGFTKGSLQLTLAIQLPNFQFPTNNDNGIGKVVQVSQATGSFFMRIDQPALAFQLGIKGDIVVLLPKTDKTKDELNLVGEVFVNMQATGVGVRVAGYMKGDWHAPMGFEGMTLRNGAILVGVDSEGGLEIGVGAKIGFDIPENDIIGTLQVLSSTKAAAFQKTQLDNLSGSTKSNNATDSELPYNEISAGFVVAATVAGGATAGIPIPKKLGFVFSADSLSLIDALGITDILMRGVLAGPLAEEVIKPIPDGPVKTALQDALKTIKQGTAVKDVWKLSEDAGLPVGDISTAIMSVTDIIPESITNVKLKNVKLFFATPGATLPGFDDLNGVMGASIEGDFYVGGKKFQVPNTTKKFVLKVTTEGIDFGGLAELMENTYLDLASVTVEALSAELNCPKGAFWDAGHSSCYSCPTGYDRSWAPVTAGNACVKRTLSKSKATFLAKANLPWSCPTNSFYDVRNEGECWSCPSGYARNANAVNHATAACTQISVATESPAISHGKGTGWFGTDCKSGQFWDPNGNCYSCPNKYARGVTAVTSKKACFKIDISLKESKATLVKSGKPKDKGAFLDVGLGEFWKCPSATPHRTVYSVKGAHACELMTVELATGKSVGRGNLINDKKCLSFDFPSGTTYLEIRENAKVELKYACSETNNHTQSWFVDSATRLRPLQYLNFKEGQNKPLCVEASGSGANTALKLAVCNHEPQQKWLFDKQERIQSRLSGKCLNKLGQLATCDKTTSQQWVKGPTLVPESKAPKPASSGSVTVQSGLNQYCLTGGKASKYISNMQPCGGKKSQVWKLNSLGELKNSDSVCLAITAGNKNAGAGLQTHKCGNKKALGEHYQWYVDDKHQIRSKLNDLCVDVINANKSAGAKLQMQTCSAKAAQTWKLVSAPASPNAVAGVKRPKPYYTKLARYKKGTGLIGTDCPKGQFWDISDGYCYSCPVGTNKVLGASVKSEKACVGYGEKPNKTVFAGGTPPNVAVGIDQKWKNIPGAAKDIAISSTGVVWVINTRNQVKYRDYATNKWVQVPGGAIKIAAGKGGKAYVVGNDGKTLFKGGVKGWTKISGSYSDVASGPSGAVWALGTTKVGAGGYAIYKHGKRGFNKVAGQAVKVAVGPKGVAYAVSEQGNIYRMDSGQKAWTKLSGSASDISVGGNNAGTVWYLSKGDVGPGGKAIYRSEDKGKTWKLVKGQLTTIAASPNGEAWGINKTGKIFDGDWRNTHQPKLTSSCPRGYSKDITKAWSAGGACTKTVFSTATLHKKVPSSCPSGQEKQLLGKWANYCISCPSGYERNILHVEASTKGACQKKSTTAKKYAKAAHKAKLVCNSGEFKDPNGKCYTCGGWRRTVFAVTANNACETGTFKLIGSTLKWKKATYKRTPPKSCARGTFGDPNGSCYSCPSGYGRTTLAVTGTKACLKAATTSTSTKVAAKHAKVGGSCPSGQDKHLIPGNDFGQCYSCSSGMVRNANPLRSGNACDGQKKAKATRSFK